MGIVLCIVCSEVAGKSNDIAVGITLALVKRVYQLRILS